MSDEYEVRKGEGVTALAYSFQKESRGPPGLTSSSDGRIAINSTYAFTSHALRRDLRFNPGIFGTDTPEFGIF